MSKTIKLGTGFDPFFFVPNILRIKLILEIIKLRIKLDVIRGTIKNKVTLLMVTIGIPKNKK